MLSRRKFLQISAASSGLAITGTDLLSRAVANAASTVRPLGSRGIRHIVILMMENRSFDHFLGWLPGADGRHDLTFVSAVDGNRYPNYPLAPDFQGCGYSDPDHSWEGWLVQHNHGQLDGFLQRPTTPPDNPGVTRAAANTFPIGYYTNLHRDGTHKALPDLPVTGALAERYTTLDRYFCAFAGETFPNRFYQHAGQTDRDHNSEAPSTLPTIWDQLSPIPNSNGIPTGGYYYRDSPFLALWASPAIEPGATFKYQAFFHPFSDADASTAALSAGVAQALVVLRRHEQAGVLGGDQGRVGQVELLPGKRERLRQLTRQARDGAGVAGAGAPDLNPRTIHPVMISQGGTAVPCRHGYLVQ
jgi:phospholipase C